MYLVVPSGEPVIVDEEGTTRLRGLVGPFNEGDPLVLICQSEQGNIQLKKMDHETKSQN